MENDRKTTFLTTELPKKILHETPELDNKGSFSEVNLSTPDHLDGFMSTIHKLSFRYQSQDGSVDRTLNLMVKVMKGSDEFREASLSKIQFTNEIYIYTKVLPVFRELIATSGLEIKPDWCPKVYFGASGHFPSYSDQYETILVLEDISPLGYIAGPRLNLEEAHLHLMTRNIASFHACTYAMRLRNDPRLENWSNEIIPFDFSTCENTSYHALFKFGIGRIYKYLDAHPEQLDTNCFKSDFKKLRKICGSSAMQLIKRLIKRDELFSVILHSDYNRNNVLFRMNIDGKPIGMKMYDFQQIRYASPAIDLSFFMYMNMTEELRERCFDELLVEYHSTMLKTLAAILKVKLEDRSLDPYRYEPFLEHLKRHALYGVVVTLHFLPWMMCPEDECEQLSYHFARDINSPEMAHLTRVCGGEEVDKRLVGVLRHASSKGYFGVLC